MERVARARDDDGAGRSARSAAAAAHSLAERTQGGVRGVAFVLETGR
jgi:hypothetical protein